MIFGAADRQGFAFVLARDASDERPEIRLNFQFDQIAAQFGRKDTMDEAGDISVRHRF